ncbi:ATP-binding cassette domain-containing protein, partial [bacterium]|nr:ATP-binding cassette domain-containing protein [bacterium]
MKLIDIKNINRTFVMEETKTIAIKDISLQIHKGEFVAIMGPSGSGKSTLLHILGFLDTQSSGDYIFDGKSNLKFNDNQLAKLRNYAVGFVFQAFNLLGKENVLEN